MTSNTSATTAMAHGMGPFSAVLRSCSATDKTTAGTAAPMPSKKDVRPARPRSRSYSTPKRTISATLGRRNTTDARSEPKGPPNVYPMSENRLTAVVPGSADAMAACSRKTSGVSHRFSSTRSRRTRPSTTNPPPKATMPVRSAVRRSAIMAGRSGVVVAGSGAIHPLYTAKEFFPDSELWSILAP